MTRDIDKEKKDQRKAECAALREVRKQQILQTVLRAANLEEAAKTLDTNVRELRARLEKYGVKHNQGERWNIAVKDYIDAGQPYQYELPVPTLEEFIDKPRFLNFEEKNLQMEFKTLQMEVKLEQESSARNLKTKLQHKLKEAIREGNDEAELVVLDPASPNRMIKYNLPLR